MECTSSKRNKNGDVISRATLAEALVTKLDLAMTDGTAPFQADVVTYNTLMKVWARASQTLAEGKGRGDVNEVIHAMEDIPEELTLGAVYTSKDAADRACEIMHVMEQKYLTGESKIAPNTYGYNIVLDGLHKCFARDSPDRVQEIFNKMKEWSSKGVKTAEDSKKECVNGDASNWTQVRPDAITYSIVMETIGQSREYGIMSKVDSLLELIEAEYEETKDPALKPVTRVSNSAINAYLRSGGGQNWKASSNKAWLTAKSVHEILNSLQRKWKSTGDASYQPDITTITMIIDAYGRCSDIAATERAEYLFESMYKQWKESGEDKLMPSSRTFTVVSIQLA